VSRPTQQPFRVSAIPRLALTVEEACEAVGVSWDTWDRYIAGQVPVVRCGRRKLVPVSALQKWLDDNAHRVLENDD
jgi:excisionase family DNA binding protein